MTVPSQLRRRAERALHKAALAIQRKDFEAKKKHIAEAELWINLLREAGEDVGFLPVLDASVTERCDRTEDMFR